MQSETPTSSVLPQGSEHDKQKSVSQLTPMSRELNEGGEGTDGVAPCDDAQIGAAWEARKQQRQHDPDTPREAFFAGALWAAGGVDACVAPSKRWPFVESPGEFTERLAAAMREFPTLLAAVRYVLIETPPTLAPGVPEVSRG